MAVRRTLLALVLLTWVPLVSAQTAPDPEVTNSAPSTPAPEPHGPSIDLNPGPDGKLSEAQMQQLFRVVAEKDLENDKRQRDYTYTERQVSHRLDGKGNIKSTETETSEVLEIYGEQVERLVAKNDKPLSARDAAKEDEKIQKIIDKRKNESDSDRRKREEREENDREDNRKFVKEVADAYNFTLVGTEQVNGRPAWVFDAEPRPGFQPQSKQAKMLHDFRGRVWIDQGDLQLSRLDVVCLDTVSFGLFLARFHKGSRFVLDQRRVNDEVWLPKDLSVKVDVRLALVKNFNVDFDQTYSDYKKFRSSSKILGFGEVPNPK